MVATTIYETENCGGDNNTPGEDVSRTNSDFGGGVGVRQTLMCQGPRASLIRPCPRHVTPWASAFGMRPMVANMAAYTHMETTTATVLVTLFR